MSKFKTAFICLLALLVLAGCKIGSDPQPDRKFYAFEQGITMTNVKKEYVVGDILWLEITVPNKQMTDITTSQVIEVGNARFIPALDVFNPFVADSTIEKFELTSLAGEIVDDVDFPKKGTSLLAYGCPESSYNMKVGVKFKKAGGYFLTFHKSQPSLQIFFTSSSDCSIQDVFPPPSEAAIGTVAYRFDTADTNRDKLDEYAAGFPAFSGNLETIRAAVDDKVAFFVRVVD